jgi:hypothetical protein
MSGISGPKIITSGCVLSLDAADKLSYKGSGTTWKDLSGNNNTGTLTNGPTFNAGNQGSISFDGTDDYVENTSPNLGITGNASVTLSCWFYFTGGSNIYVLLAYGNGPDALDTFAITVNTDYSVTFSFNGGSYVGSNQNVITTNTWYNLVGTKTPGAINTTTKLYLNGSEISILFASTGTPNVVSRVIRVGRWIVDAYPYYFQGRVANCLIYNRALSATEILNNYNATKSRFNR